MQNNTEKGYFPEFKDIPTEETFIPLYAPVLPQYTEEQLLQLYQEEELNQLAQDIEYPDNRDLK